MCGRATLAMEVSSTSMKVARVTVRAMSHGLKRGRQTAGGALKVVTAGEAEMVAVDDTGLSLTDIGGDCQQRDGAREYHQYRGKGREQEWGTGKQRS